MPFKTNDFSSFCWSDIPIFLYIMLSLPTNCFENNFYRFFILLLIWRRSMKIQLNDDEFCTMSIMKASYIFLVILCNLNWT